MKSYLLSTGIVFAVLVMAHIWRLVVEGAQMLRDPWFLGSTLLATSFSIWAWRLYQRAGAGSV